MNYIKFDIETWQRKEHFQLFDAQLNCGFSLTTKLDITVLKKRIDSSDYAFYPTLIYLLSKIVNSYPEFRFAKKEGELILWDVVSPSFTLFHQNTETFSSLWSEYSDDISTFMANYNQQMSLFKDNLSLSPQPKQIENIFYISSLPWVVFDSFNLNIADITKNFAPIFTMGQFHYEQDKIVLPLAVQVHHAVCDGFHVGRLINQLQKLCDEITF
ncbi:type A chloramphenicol O-acetyltransferase [Providencia heimbachae]|uniref:Chloramphenicol acetyltransferase n=1 Tax=Providencia heimbachae ATCC 35613 TaxID=1354272 RepID=A0A1B7K380_9GAMM|nr:type A chloramphenicol O-acetyltransferase [Providencia heimbachae]OAT54484.1 chloramphenicol acetyltransferase [Providencia heimbachae ATCC 35613]SQH13534.1 Chloramphenicol acetyltransferase 3 [Providencia heimbachae]